MTPRNIMKLSKDLYLS